MNDSNLSKFEKAVIKVDKVLAGIENIIGGTAFVVMLLFVLFGIISRVFIHLPVTWIEESSRHLLVVGVYMGVSILTREKSHLALTMIPDSLPKKAGAVMKFVGELMAFATLILVSVVVIQYSQQAFKFNQLSPALRYPMGYMYLYIASAFILSAIRQAMMLWNDYIAKNKVLERTIDDIAAT